MPMRILRWGPLACALLSACGRTPPANATDELVKLTPEQAALVMDGDATEVMTLVTNDTSAGDELLRTPSLPVGHGDPVVARLVERMRATMEAEEGVGIAAPQVAISRRVILVERVDIEGKPVRAYLNPEILEASEEKIVDWEGCLSIPAGFGKVKRAASIVIAYLAGEGGRGTETVQGYAARIFQHEIDHLDGVLFIDRKEPGDLMPEDDYREMKAKEAADG